MNFREVSKKTWRCNGAVPSREEINAGSLQRIADATETMSSRHRDLIDRNNRLEKYNKHLSEVNENLRRRLSAMKGVATRQRNQIKQAKEGM